ncbi:MHS family MFS transporter [Jejubacter calystegiae]|uniref:MHS family MFS transporter n=2 Tax=Jejubacter calystegiae TaxID=2579935 RepID=A0A4P8YK54_9ENTR|nr:MFS transporter [Jejubacter calystegiae]QCT20483.1 MHS family MFS transporter [Jejubacter calystegiae]
MAEKEPIMSVKEKAFGTGVPEHVARRRVVIASFMGALLEWYDFFIFGTAAGLVFNSLFFPAENAMVGTIAAFAAFGVGFVSRPLGGLIFGHFGDLIGRKVTLIWTLSIVGVSTFLIGLLPTWQQVGIWAPIMLMVIRLIQGVGLGGEYGGAALMTFESVPEKRRGFFCSIPQTASCAGIMLATGVFALCNYLLTAEQFMAWGWRIPFLLSAVMLLVGMYIRVNIEETADFKQVKKVKRHDRQKILETPMAQREPSASKPKESIPLVLLLRQHLKGVMLAFGARLVEAVSSNIINAFGIAYLASQLAMDRSIPLNSMLLASAIGLIVCPLSGWISDQVGLRRVYLFGAAFCALFAFPFFMLLNTGDPLLIALAMIIGYNLGPTAMFAVQPTMYANMFSTQVRYTGLSVAYQFSAIPGGMTPLIAALLLAAGDGAPWYVASYFVAVSLLSLLCVWMIKNKGEEAVADASSLPGNRAMTG